MKNHLFESFLEVATVLNKKLSITPLLYGSLGLNLLTRQDFNPLDIDVLIPSRYLNTNWPELKSLMEELGYRLTNLHEHEFSKGKVKLAFAGIENLEDFAGINYSSLVTQRIEEAFFYLLSLDEYIKVYEQSALDGYRKMKKNKKDLEKVTAIKEYLKVSQ